jgi:hypothetical protein
MHKAQQALQEAKKMEIKNWKMAILTAILLGSMLSFTQNNEVEAQALWTFMVYLDGDNNLESAGIDDLNEMEFAGSSASVNIVVQFDRTGGYDTSNGDWTTARRYYVTKDANGYDSTIVSTMIADLGELNMGNPQTLINFANWAMTNYPAQNYALILWDHGGGWKFPTDPVKGVCWDNTDGFDYLTQPELRWALSQVTGGGANKIEVVGFDACLMGMLEIDYDIMTYAGYRVGSEESEPGDGWDYQATLSALVATPAMTPAQLGTQIVNDYMNFYGVGGFETQSAIDLSKIQALVTATNNFSVYLLSKITIYCPQMQTARTNSEFYLDPDYIDLYRFAQLINATIGDAAIQAGSQKVMNAITNAVVAEGHGAWHPNSKGISIYYPLTAQGYMPSYETDVLFPMNTCWDEYIKASYTCIPPPWPPPCPLPQPALIPSTPLNPDTTEMMRPLAAYVIEKAKTLYETVEEKVEEIDEDDPLYEKCHKDLEEAMEFIEKAEKFFMGGNYIAANYWALKAIAKLNEILKYLEG